MAEAEFDAVAADYVAQHTRSIRLSGEDSGYFARYKIAATHKIMNQRKLPVRKILDFGSGIGSSLQPMREFFPESYITCLDVSEESLKFCKDPSVEHVSYRVYDGNKLPSDMGSFDLIFSACVFHHIDTGSHVSLLCQIRNMLSPGGLFVLFEHNPWNPLTRYAVSICPFDENAVLISAPEMSSRLRLAGFQTIETTYRVFFPGPFAAWRKFESALGWLPLGAQYSLTAA